MTNKNDLDREQFPGFFIAVEVKQIDARAIELNSSGYYYYSTGQQSGINLKSERGLKVGMYRETIVIRSEILPSTRRSNRAADY